MPRPTRTRPLLAVTAPLLAVALLLGGCGSDDTADEGTDPTASSEASASPSGTPEVSEEFRTCLEDRGVELPTEQSTDGALPSVDPKMQEALQACASLAPSGGPGGAGVPGEIDQSTLDAFADCMADNGVKVEATLEAVTKLDQADKAISKALETCAPLIQP